MKKNKLTLCLGLLATCAIFKVESRWNRRPQPPQNISVQISATGTTSNGSSEASFSAPSTNNAHYLINGFDSSISNLTLTNNYTTTQIIIDAPIPESLENLTLNCPLGSIIVKSTIPSTLKTITLTAGPYGQNSITNVIPESVAVRSHIGYDGVNNYVQETIITIPVNPAQLQNGSYTYTNNSTVSAPTFVFPSNVRNSALTTITLINNGATSMNITGAIPLSVQTINLTTNANGNNIVATVPASVNTLNLTTEGWANGNNIIENPIPETVTINSNTGNCNGYGINTYANGNVINSQSGS